MAREQTYQEKCDMLIYLDEMLNLSYDAVKYDIRYPRTRAACGIRWTHIGPDDKEIVDYTPPVEGELKRLKQKYEMFYNYLTADELNLRSENSPITVADYIGWAIERIVDLLHAKTVEEVDDLLEVDQI